MAQRVAGSTDEIPEMAQRVLDHLRPTHLRCFQELLGFAEAAGLEAELPASSEQYDRLYQRLREAGHGEALRRRYGAGFADVWREYQEQYREWKDEYRTRGRKPWTRPPLFIPMPTVFTRAERRQLIMRPEWTSYWPLGDVAVERSAD